ncbi:MAG: recombinase family protein [candidate division Zixibacteria bacterium]|nr:recombinase family protein [candidate division Zixibacteria bacterium]
MSKIAIYARKSTESEDKQVQSIDSQVRELKAYASKMGWRVDHVFVESKSAKAPGRPIFNKLFDLIQKGEVNELISWKLDRLARNPVDGGAIIWAMEENNLINIHTPQRTFCNSGNDKFWLQLEFGMAKKYVDDLRDNVKRGIRAKLENGWYPHRPPLGYLNDKEKKTIIPDPDRFRIVRKMWNFMLTGDYTPERILAIASERWGLRTRLVRTGGGKPLNRSAVYKLFNNPFYYGMMTHQENLHNGKHKPMITKSEFDKVRSILESRNKQRGHRHFFKYTGLIRCGECGSMITAENKTNRFGSKYIYYRCTKKKRDIKCSQKYIEEKELEAQILTFLDSITISNSLLEWALRHLTHLQVDESKNKEAITRSIRKRLDISKGQRAELVNLKLRNLLTDDEFLAKKAEIEAECNDFKTQLKDSARNNGQTIEQCIKLFDFAAGAKDAFITGSDSEKKRVLRYFGSNLVLTDKTLNVHGQKPFLSIIDTLNNHFPENTPVEPKNKNELQRNTGARKAECLNWYCLVDEVRTYFKESNDITHSI